MTFWFKSKELCIAYVTENKAFYSFKDNKQKLIDLFSMRNNILEEAPQTHILLI